MPNSLFYTDDDFSKLKRKLYLILLPTLTIAFGVVWYIVYFHDNMNKMNLFTFSTLCSGFGIGMILLVLKKNDLRYVEGFVFFVGAFVYITRFYYNVIYQLGVVDTHIGTLTYWVSLLYIIIFITFQGKKGFILSLIMFLITLLPGMYHIIYSPNLNGDTLDSLIQFYVSNFGYIIALYYLQRVIEVYLHAETAKHIANTDFLTNLPNRRFMDRLLHEEMEKIKKGKSQKVSCILFDVDRFKQINDTYGHDIGDIILQEIAHFVENNIRETDHFGRWGGEEFLIIAKNKNLESAKVLAERLRTMIENHTFKATSKLTCSFGVSEYKPNDLGRDLLKRADKALYEAKESGRNLVMAEK